VVRFSLGKVVKGGFIGLRVLMARVSFIIEVFEEVFIMVQRRGNNYKLIIDFIIIV